MRTLLGAFLVIGTAGCQPSSPSNLNPDCVAFRQAGLDDCVDAIELMGNSADSAVARGEIAGWFSGEEGQRLRSEMLLACDELGRRQLIDCSTSEDDDLAR